MRPMNTEFSLSGKRGHFDNNQVLYIRVQNKNKLGSSCTKLSFLNRKKEVLQQVYKCWLVR
jgi:hypothetical protein